jgi:hypothetical protein
VAWPTGNGGAVEGRDPRPVACAEPDGNASNEPDAPGVAGTGLPFGSVATAVGNGVCPGRIVGVGVGTGVGCGVGVGTAVGTGVGIGVGVGGTGVGVGGGTTVTDASA